METGQRRNGKGAGLVCVWIKYSNGIEQEIPCYDGELTDKTEELYFCLLEYFEPEEINVL